MLWPGAQCCVQAAVWRGPISAAVLVTHGAQDLMVLLHYHLLRLGMVTAGPADVPSRTQRI